MGSRSGDKLALGSARVESDASKEAQGKRREKKGDEEGTRGMEKRGCGNKGEGGATIARFKSRAQRIMARNESELKGCKKITPTSAQHE